MRGCQQSGCGAVKAWLRGWPQSLMGRISLILFAGLALAHVLSFWLVVMERSLAMGGMMVNYLASDVASSVAILERLPPAERAAWLPRLERPNYRLAPLEHGVALKPSQSALAQAVASAVGAALVPPRDVRVVDVGDAGALSVQLRLVDGAALAIELAQPRLRISPWVLAVLALQLTLLAGLSWWAVSLATRPLRRLAQAADALNPAQLSPALAGAPLSEQGPREVAGAARAFNAMQARIHAHLNERMHILAAVSHDLQTPITRLRLRADLLDDTVLRDKLHADLAEMQALVEQGISYARSAHAMQESTQRVELQALMASLVADYTDAGHAVSLTLGDPSPGRCQTRPQALRRVVCNLVDNALKFAGAAEISLQGTPEGGWQVCVLDRGPGIPAQELEAVMQPFYRVENSRNRSTGGTGLGLAIAQQLALALDATLTLAPRTGGGLQACLVCCQGLEPVASLEPAIDNGL